MERHVVDELVPDEPAAVRLMDTVLADRAGVRDALTSRAELVAFLSGLAGAAPHRVTADDLAAARHLRDALRRLAADVTGDDRAEGHSAMSVAAATAAVNDAVRGRPAPVLRRARGAWHFEPVDRSVRALLGGLAAEGAALLADPGRPLGACFAPGCVLYFVRDHPRREWCSVSCGNRARAARHYARVRAR